MHFIRNRSLLEPFYYKNRVIPGDEASTPTLVNQKNQDVLKTIFDHQRPTCTVK